MSGRAGYAKAPATWQNTGGGEGGRGGGGREEDVLVYGRLVPSSLIAVSDVVIAAGPQAIASC